MTDEQAAPAAAGGEAQPTPNPGTTPAPADAGAAATPTNGADTAAKTTEDEGDGEDGQPKKVKGGFQKRIDTLTREKRELERRYHELASAAVNRGEAPKVPQGQRAATAEPKPEDYPSYDKYLEARETHILAKAREQVRAELRAGAEHQSRQAKAKAYAEATAKAADRYEDYEEVAHNPDLPITAAMAEAISESDKSADLAYWLGSHPDDAHRISKLSPLAQARELGRIEATLQAPPARKTTSAPDPVKTVAGKDTPSSDPEKMSVDEWMKHRKKQLAKG